MTCELIGGALLGASLIGLVLYHAMLAKEEHQLLRETSRFPMFAARDQLVSLVITGEMSEDDAAWRNAYRTVNSLLGMHQRLHLPHLLYSYARHVCRIETDVQYRQAYLTMLNAEREASKRIPEFAAACKSVDEAFAHLVRRRTRAIHWVTVAGILAAMVVLFTLITAGLKVASAVASALNRPESQGSKYFGVQAGC